MTHPSFVSSRSPWLTRATSVLGRACTQSLALVTGPALRRSSCHTPKTNCSLPPGGYSFQVPTQYEPSSERPISHSKSPFLRLASYSSFPVFSHLLTTNSDKRILTFAVYTVWLRRTRTRTLNPCAELWSAVRLVIWQCGNWPKGRSSLRSTV